MTNELWNLYMTLQTSLAYGDVVAPDMRSMATVQAYVEAMGEIASFDRALVIGPLDLHEVDAVVGKLRQGVEMHVLTAHAPSIDVLRRREYLHVALGDMHNTPYESGYFDFIFASNVLEHAFAPYIALMECRRILRPGGIAYFVLPSFEGEEGGRGPFHLHCLTKEVWLELLRKTGFVVVDVQTEYGNETAAGGHYFHFKAAATEPPHPHGRLLNELIVYRSGGAR